MRDLDQSYYLDDISQLSEEEYWEAVYMDKIYQSKVS